MPPPKKKDTKSERGQQKALEREKQKIVEDKTFGLKNKNKSKAVQKFIKSVQQQAKGPQKGGETHEIAKRKEEQQLKKAQLQQQMLLQALFKGTENVKKVAAETNSGSYDPKESKLEQKIDLYVDQREQNGSGLMELSELETAIVCRFFLEAVERKQYGWFWVCPNGGDSCKYRHCLPQGYVLKGDEEEPEAESDQEPIEETIERQRQELPAGGTPVTVETFKAWKEKKEAERLLLLQQQQRDNKKGLGASRVQGTMPLSGKDLFSFDPSLFVDMEGAADEGDYEEDEDWQEEVRRNQETLEAANAAARTAALREGHDEAETQQTEEKETEETAEVSATEKRQEEKIQYYHKELFADDLAPGELDALDD